MFDMQPNYLTNTLITLLGDPMVKKNGQRVVGTGKNTRKINTPQYTRWVHKASTDIGHYGHVEPINFPVNVQVRFFMSNHRNVDLTNLLEGPMDLLVAAQVLLDDNYKIVASVDGSGVFVDSVNPRIEILISARNSAPVKKPLAEAKPSEDQIPF